MGGELIAEEKDDVLSLIDSMDAIAVPDSIWKALYNKAKDGDTNAIKTWLQYRFGPKPIEAKQKI
jgi:hypothetical protein